MIDGCRPCHGTGLVWADTAPPVGAKAVAPEPLTLPARPPPFIPPRPETEPPPTRIPSPAEATAAPMSDEAWVAAIVGGQPFRGPSPWETASLQPTVLDATGRSTGAVSTLMGELRRIGWVAATPYSVPVTKVVTRHRLDDARTTPWFIHQLCAPAVAAGSESINDVPTHRHSDPELFAAASRYFGEHGYKQIHDHAWHARFVRDPDPKFTTAAHRAKLWVADAIVNAFPWGPCLDDTLPHPDIPGGAYLPAIPDDLRTEVLAELKARGCASVNEYAGRTDIGFAIPQATGGQA